MIAGWPDEVTITMLAPARALGLLGSWALFPDLWVSVSRTQVTGKTEQNWKEENRTRDEKKAQERKIKNAIYSPPEKE